MFGPLRTCISGQLTYLSNPDLHAGGDTGIQRRVALLLQQLVVKRLGAAFPAMPAALLKGLLTANSLDNRLRDLKKKHGVVLRPAESKQWRLSAGVVDDASAVDTSEEYVAAAVCVALCGSGGGGGAPPVPDPDDHLFEDPPEEDHEQCAIRATDLECNGHFPGLPDEPSPLVGMVRPATPLSQSW